MNDAMLFIFGLLISASITIGLIVKVVKLKKMIKLLSSSYDKIESLLSLKQSNISDSDVHKESFIKFLSDSRDWAYEYIENVQVGLNKFIEDVDKDIIYFDKYGDVLSTERPDYAALKNISVAYKELKKLLPEKE